MKRPIAELLEELNTVDEHARLEAKSGLGDSALETVSAFANEPGLGGGYLVFGVKLHDGQYDVIGVEDPDSLTQQLANQCNDETLNHVVRPTIWTELLEGKRVVAAYIPEARPSEKPIYLKKRGLPKGAYRRIGSTDIKCSDDDLRALHRLAADRPYEDTLVPDATVEDLDPDVITSYRKILVEQNPATEMRDLDLYGLVQALGGARNEKGAFRPTVAGVLLFGKPLALRRLFPMHRVDYIRVPGTEWIEDTERRYETLDVRQPLLIAFRRIYQAIFDDLPKTVEVRVGSPERVEAPTVPERVIREALVNALCHRDYRVQSPTQIIRYANRIEFRNAGHSLVSDDMLGEPGSESRNPRMADVFREMGLAENKGSGIRVMRREMDRAQLARPLFESDRGRNRFVAKLLFTHLLSEEQREWLSSLGEPALSREQQVALVCARESGEVRNADLRDLTGLDTLAASKVLQGLRDRGVLELRDAGSKAHYVLTGRAQPVEAQAEPPEVFEGAAEAPVVAEPLSSSTGRPEQLTFQNAGGPVPAGGEVGHQAPGHGADRGEVSPHRGEVSPHRGEVSPDRGEVTLAGAPDSGRSALLERLPGPLRAELDRLGTRPRSGQLRGVIRKLCAVEAWRPRELALLLQRTHAARLVDRHLRPMREEGVLEWTHPENPHHQDQAYRTVGAQQQPGPEGEA